MTPIEATFVGVVDGVPYVVLPNQPNQRQKVDGLAGGPYPVIDDKVLVDYADSGRLWFVCGPRPLPAASSGQGLLWDGSSWTTPNLATQAELDAGLALKQDAATAATDAELAAVNTALDGRLDALEAFKLLDFHVWFEGSSTATGTGAWTNVGSGSGLDPYNALNESTGIWTVPTAGKYIIVGYGQYQNAGAGQQAGVSALYSLGPVQVDMWRAYNSVAALYPSGTGFWMVNATAGQTLTFRYFHTEGAVRTVAWRFLIFKALGV